jgi:hypothetical protein
MPEHLYRRYNAVVSGIKSSLARCMAGVIQIAARLRLRVRICACVCVFCLYLLQYVSAWALWFESIQIDFLSATVHVDSDRCCDPLAQVRHRTYGERNVPTVQ